MLACRVFMGFVFSLISLNNCLALSQGELFLTIHSRETNGFFLSTQILCEGHLVDSRTVLVSVSCLDPLIQSKKENREAKIAPKLSHFEVSVTEGSVSRSGVLPLVVYHPSLDSEDPDPSKSYGLIFLSSKIHDEDSFEKKGFPEKFLILKDWIFQEKSHQTVFFRSPEKRSSHYWSSPEIWKHHFLEKTKEERPIIDVVSEKEDEKKEEEEEDVSKKEKKTFLEKMEKTAKKRQKEKETLLKRIHSTSWSMATEEILFPDNAYVSHKQWSVICREPGALHVSENISLDDLTIDHQAFRISIPQFYQNGETKEDFEKKLESFIEDGKFEESIDLQDQYIGFDEKGQANIKSLLEVKNLALKKGMLELWGEIQTGSFIMDGGFLLGYGKIIVPSSGLFNKGGIIAPGYTNQFIKTDKIDSPDPLEGQLKLVGNYTQKGYSEDEETGSVGTLRFYVTENKSHKLVSDKFYIQGEANLDGNLQIFVKPGLDLHNKTFQFIYATQGIQGRFARVEIASGNRYTFIPKITYKKDLVEVTFYNTSVFHQKVFNQKGHHHIHVSHTKIFEQSGESKIFHSFVLDGGFLRGTGRIRMDEEQTFINCGHMMVGHNESYGRLLIAGNYVQCRSSDPETSPGLSGHLTLTAGSKGHDHLEISGHAKLGGRLTIVTKDPQELRGQTINVLKADKISGVFSQVVVLNSKLKAKIEYSEKSVDVTFYSERLQHMAEDKGLQVEQEDQKILEMIEDLDDQGKITPRKLILNMMKNGVAIDERFLKSLAFLKAQMDLNHKTAETIAQYKDRFELQSEVEAQKKEEFIKLLDSFHSALNQACILHLRLAREGHTEDLQKKVKECDDVLEKAKEQLELFLTPHI